FPDSQGPADDLRDFARGQGGQAVPRAAEHAGAGEAGRRTGESPEGMSGARFLVSGRVQGVWFRAATRERALALQLRGYARNLADGSVEVVATGEDAALGEL